MKTERISKFVTVSTVEYCEQYRIHITNLTSKVKKFHCRFMKMDKKGIQEMVDKLIKLKMITIFENNTTDTTEVHIRIWDIDETNELYIETYHRNPDLPDNELFDDYDGVMKYEDFLNEV